VGVPPAPLARSIPRKKHAEAANSNGETCANMERVPPLHLARPITKQCRHCFQRDTCMQARPAHEPFACKLGLNHAG